MVNIDLNCIVHDAKVQFYFYIASDILKKVEKILTKLGYDEDDPVYFINDLLILGELVFFSQFGLFLHELDNWTHLEGNPADHMKQEASQKDLLFQRFIESTVAQIKYYLLQTDLTVKEIAFKLDFPDVSFFCKYVKKHLGEAPLEYRNGQLLPKA